MGEDHPDCPGGVFAGVLDRVGNQFGRDELGVLRELGVVVGATAPFLRVVEQRFGFRGDPFGAPLVAEGRADNLAAALEDDGGTDLRGDLAKALQGGGGVHGLTLTRHRLADTPGVNRAYRPVAKFLDDRGPHLAAMIAYFALLSFVPLTFLALSLLGLAGRADESSYLVTELKKAFPQSSISSIVDVIRKANGLV